MQRSAVSSDMFWFPARVHSKYGGGMNRGHLRSPEVPATFSQHSTTLLCVELQTHIVLHLVLAQRYLSQDVTGKNINRSFYPVRLQLDRAALPIKNCCLWFLNVVYKKSV